MHNGFLLGKVRRLETAAKFAAAERGSFPFAAHVIYVGLLRDAGFQTKRPIDTVDVKPAQVFALHVLGRTDGAHHNSGHGGFLQTIKSLETSI